MDRRALLPAGALAFLLTLPAAAADPVHESLLREGTMAFERGDLSAAIKYLRLACFGLLEEPRRFGDCLIRLAVAEGSADDRAGFTNTFSRILEVEQRFEGYSRAPTPPELRERFEQLAGSWISSEHLQAVPAFAGLATDKLTEELGKLPPAARRDLLEDRLAAEPDAAGLRVHLAELELSEDRPEAAAEALRGVEPFPGLACIQGRVLAALDDCSTSLDQLAGCHRPRTEPAIAEALLRCQLRLRRWDEAELLLGELPADLRGRQPFRGLARDLRRSRRSPSPPPPATETLPEVDDGAVSSEPPSPPEPLPESARAQLAEARRLVEAASRAGDLDRPFELAQEVADAHPEASEAQSLAAEIAYRSTRWPEAVHYFRRAGEPDPGRPELSFYFAVALYETGERQAAQQVLRECLPRLERTSYVRAYVEKILGSPEEGA